MAETRNVIAIGLELVPFFLLSIAAILSIVGYVAVWGSASVDLGIIQSSGDFTLTTITVYTEVIGIQLPEKTYEISETLCSGDLLLSEIDEVCQKFATMRIFTILTLVASISAMAFSCAKCAASLPKSGSRIIRKVLPAMMAFAALLAAVFSIVALAVAASLPEDNPHFQLRHSAGPGSIAMVVLVVLAISAAIFELSSCCCCKGLASKENESKRSMKQAHESHESHESHKQSEEGHGGESNV